MLGYAFDRSDQALNAGLASIRSGRVERAQRMSAELEKVGIEGAFDGAMRYAANPSLISRAHFGRFLVDSGVAKDLRSVFESYLVPGRPGYVDHRWATLADSLAWVHAAGGLVAVAHPGRYKLSRVEMRRFLAEFKDLGGAGDRGGIGQPHAGARRYLRALRQGVRLSGLAWLRFPRARRELF
jgi:predicted metal-dependent phosphoesterase TrpH